MLATEGRAICVAAGNAGQEKGETPEDIGWVLGRIHGSGQIAAAGLSAELDWTVVGNSIVDVSENELEIWYGAQDRFSVHVRPPGASEWISVEPGQFIENRRLPSGTFLSIYNELYHPVNGCNYISLYLSPDLSTGSPVGVQAGLWTVRLTGKEVRDGKFHCWIERDDPYEFDRVGERRVARFPSFFSERSNVDSHSISSLACGPTMCTPRISSVAASARNLTMPVVSPSARARPLAMNGKVPALYLAPRALSCCSVSPTQAISGLV